MGKSVILTLLLLVLAAGSLGYAHAWVDKDKDAVSIEETVLSGSKAAAEGITVRCRLICGDRLCWDNVYTVGKSPALHTDFSFSPRTDYSKRSSFSHPILVQTGHYDHSIAEDVASRTPAGKTRTEIISLKDYCDFYPVSVSIHLPHFGVEGELTEAEKSALNEAFADYFRIPVHPEHRYMITLDKRSAGTIGSYTLQPFGEVSVYLGGDGVVADSGCYFTVSCHTDGGELLDTSRIPGGYGVYCLPYSRDGESIVLAPEALHTAFSLDAERGPIVNLNATPDKSRLLLVTLEDGAYLLRVLDPAADAELQQLKLWEKQGDEGFHSLHVYEDFLVFRTDDDRFALFTKNDRGAYEPRFTGDFNVGPDPWSFSSGEVIMDYNGEALAAAVLQHSSKNMQIFCSFYLCVYNADGLAYAGHYEFNQNKTALEDYNYVRHCQPARNDPLSLSWE